MMTRLERAKQFMPFDAMKGLQEALRDREERHLRTQRREISEEAKQEIFRTLSQIDRPTPVRIRHYLNFHDVESTGTVTAVELAYGYLKLDESKIYFADLYSIEVIENSISMRKWL